MTKNKKAFPSYLTIEPLPTDPKNFTKNSNGKHKEDVFDVSSYEDGIQALHDFNASGLYQNGYAWSVLIENEGVLTVYYRYAQPCFGEICLYEADGRELKNPSAKVNKPGDLFNPFPDGTPLAFGLPVKGDVRYLRQLFDPEVSPWRGCLKGRGLTEKGSEILGLIVNDMDTDPTLMVNLFKHTRTYTHSYTQAVNFQEANNLPFWKAVIKAIVGAGSPYLPSYAFTPRFNTERFANGDYINLVEGGSIRERYSYNRPLMEYSFSDNGKTTPVNPLFEGMVQWGSATVSETTFNERLIAA